MNEADGKHIRDQLAQLDQRIRQNGIDKHLAVKLDDLRSQLAVTTDLSEIKVQLRQIQEQLVKSREWQARQEERDTQVHDQLSEQRSDMYDHDRGVVGRVQWLENRCESLCVLDRDRWRWWKELARSVIAAIVIGLIFYFAQIGAAHANGTSIVSPEPSPESWTPNR